MPKRRAICIFLVILLLYPLSYLVVSKDGLYLVDLTATLEKRATTLSETKIQALLYHNPDDGIVIRKWNPFPSLKKPSLLSSTAIFYFYYPMIHLDRHFWHRNKEITPEPRQSEVPAMPFPVAPPTHSVHS
ncbi:hypothetical protein [Haloferula sp.]|uniref:hypothetical protein n=1 Tax=Haloferula sp. TaxID=2497595 RepID=UPI003C724B4E